MLYFGAVPTVLYFGTVLTVLYFEAVPTVLYFGAVPTVLYYFFHCITYMCAKCNTVGTAPKYNTVRTAPKLLKSSSGSLSVTSLLLIRAFPETMTPPPPQQ